VEIVNPPADVRVSLVSPVCGVEEELLAALVEMAGDEIESCECELLGPSVGDGAADGH
jgi:hypothetical protein